MKKDDDIPVMDRTYTSPSSEVIYSLPYILLETSNGAKTEDYKEEDIWNI